MLSNNNDLLRRHISTHSEHSAEDRAAVSTLETFLTSGGKINTNFSCDDKWPNHDGTFEFVSNPEISRCPEQNFIVQIKGNKGQKESNLRYLSQCNINFEDPLKKVALQKLFVNSQVMLIYGAAGTGKTTLINHISNMMNQSKKLFLTKTYTALQNLKRLIDNPGLDSDFVSIDI